MNSFSSKIANSLKLPKSKNASPFSDNTDHPALKLIVKRRNHSAILAIYTVHKITERFTFKPDTLTENVVKEIGILVGCKPIQEIFIPVKRVKCKV